MRSALGTIQQALDQIAAKGSARKATGEKPNSFFARLYETHPFEEDQGRAFANRCQWSDVKQCELRS